MQAKPCYPTRRFLLHIHFISGFLGLVIHEIKIPLSSDKNMSLNLSMLLEVRRGGPLRSSFNIHRIYTARFSQMAMW
jgi:hypothetical protein